MQNRLFIGRDNPIVLEFNFTGDFASGGLSNFDNITVNIGGEEYSTNNDPDKIIVDGDALRIAIGDVTQLTPGFYQLELIGYSSTYDDGYVLACGGYQGLDRLQIVSC